MRDKLAAAGLVDRQERIGLGKFLGAYIGGRNDIKQSTRDHLQRAADDLTDFFGESRDIKTITSAEAEQFKRWLKHTRNLHENTANRRTGRARQFFTNAIKQGLITSNPFDGLKVTVHANEDRFYFVPADDVLKIIEAAPCWQWRLLIALSRFAGLRTPSEPLQLKWGDILWDENKMIITSPKLEHHHDKGKRIIPIFAEVRPYLEEAWGNAEEGQEFVLTRFKRTGRETNLRTEFGRIAQRAGVDLWGKPFQNMRSTRQTELAETFPQHVVCKWIGNSQAVAAKHYLRPTDDHFQRASRPGEKEGQRVAQNAAHSTPERGGNGQKGGNCQETRKTASGAGATSCGHVRLSACSAKAYVAPRLRGVGSGELLKSGVRKRYVNLQSPKCQKQTPLPATTKTTEGENNGQKHHNCSRFWDRGQFE